MKLGGGVAIAYHCLWLQQIGKRKACPLTSAHTVTLEELFVNLKHLYGYVGAPECALDFPLSKPLI